MIRVSDDGVPGVAKKMKKLYSYLRKRVKSLFLREVITRCWGHTFDPDIITGKSGIKELTPTMSSLEQTVTEKKSKITKETILFLILGIVTIITGWLYLSTGFDATWGGDDSIVHLSMYNATKDQSYLQCFLHYLQQAFETYLHPAETYRFLPLAYWNDAVWKFASYSLTNYRIAVLFYTYLAIFLTAVFLGCMTKNRNMALLCLALTPLIVNLYSSVEVNALYTYQAMAQRSYIFWMIGELFLYCHAKRKKIGFLIAAAVFTFLSCSVLEIGYLFIFPCFLIVFLLHEEWKQRIIAFGSQCVSVVLAFTGYCICASAQGMNTDTSTRFQLSPIVETISKQMAASFSLPPVLLSGQELHFADIRAQDILLPLLLAGVAAVMLCQCSEKKQPVQEKTGGILCCIALLILVLPAGLISITEKFQISTAITWTQGWIMSIVGTMGVGLLAAILVSAIAGWIRRNTGSSWFGILLIALLSFFIGCTGVYSRAATNVSGDKHTRPRNDVLIESLQSEVLSGVPEGAPLYCDYGIWGNSAPALQMFFEIYGNRSFETACYEGQEMEEGAYFSHYQYGDPISLFYVGKLGEDPGTLQNVTVWIRDQNGAIQKEKLTYVNEGGLHTIAIRPADGGESVYYADIPQMNFADLYIE